MANVGKLGASANAGWIDTSDPAPENMPKPLTAEDLACLTALKKDIPVIQSISYKFDARSDPKHPTLIVSANVDPNTFGAECERIADKLTDATASVMLRGIKVTVDVSQPDDLLPAARSSKYVAASPPPRKTLPPKLPAPRSAAIAKAAPAKARADQRLVMRSTRGGPKRSDKA